MFSKCCRINKFTNLVSMYLFELGTDNMAEDGNGGGDICDDMLGGNSTAAGEG